MYHNTDAYSPRNKPQGGTRRPGHRGQASLQTPFTSVCHPPCLRALARSDVSLSNAARLLSARAPSEHCLVASPLRDGNTTATAPRPLCHGHCAQATVPRPLRPGHCATSGDTLAYVLKPLCLPGTLLHSLSLLWVEQINSNWVTPSELSTRAYDGEEEPTQGRQQVDPQPQNARGYSAAGHGGTPSRPPQAGLTTPTVAGPYLDPPYLGD